MRKIDKVAIMSFLSFEVVCLAVVGMLNYHQQPLSNWYSNENSYLHSNLVNTHSGMLNDISYKLIMKNG